MEENTLRISVVFSFRNEEDSLKELIARVSNLKEALFRLDIPRPEFELIFVNDASSDGSLGILMNEQEKRSDEIIVINMSRRFGVGPCVLAGLASATGKVVIYMDSDLHSYDSIADLKAGLKTYFSFFNQERTHQSLARQTPDEVYFADRLRKAA